jgi:hypothetical protein
MQRCKGFSILLTYNPKGRDFRNPRSALLQALLAQTNALEALLASLFLLTLSLSYL